MKRYDKCERPCEVIEHEWEETHGFSFGPHEQWNEEFSECCGAEVYDDGKSEADETEGVSDGN